MRPQLRAGHLIGILATLALFAPAVEVRAQVLTFPAEINKSFTPISIVAGQVSRLSVTVFNPNSFQLDNAAWADDLIGIQPGLAIADPVNLTNTCSGSVIALPAGTSLSLTGGTVPAQLGATPGECTVAVDVTSITPGNLVDTIPAGALTATGGGGDITNTTPASATLRVNAVQPPSLSKAFSPNTVWIGQVSQLAITIRNNDLYNALTQTALADDLPANVVLASPVSSSMSGCGPATLTATAGATSLTLSDATVAASGTCIIRVNVTSATPDVYDNSIPIGAIQTRQGVTNSRAAAAQLNVQAVGVSKAFSPTSFQAGDTSTSTITLRNPTASAYTGVSLIDDLPGTVLRVVGGSASTTCGGTADTSMPRTVSLTGGTIPAGTTSLPGSCTITVQVTTPAGASAASFTNWIYAGDLHTDQGVTNILPVSATVSIYRAGTGVPGSKAFSPSTINPGGNSRLRITISAPLDTPPPGLTGFSLVDDLPLGVTISNSSPAATSNCGGSASLTATPGASTITLTDGTITRPTSCIIDVWVTSASVGSYLNIIRPADVSSLEDRTLAANLTATLTVAAVVPPSDLSISKSFYPNTVNTNGLSALTISLQNTNASPLVSVTLTDTLPGTVTNGVVVAPIPNASSTCGGSVTAVAGTQTISLAGGVIPAQVLGVPGLCTVTLDVQGKGVSATRTNTLLRTNVSGTIQGTGTVINPTANASANLTIASMSVGIVKGFNPLTVFGGSASVLSVQLTNPNNAILAGIMFTDTMPAGMIVANPAGLSVGTCAGSLVAAPGDGAFSFSGGTLAAAATCTLTLNVTMTTNGNLTNVISAGAVTTRNGATNPQPAEASLTNLPGASLSKFFTPNPVANGSGDYSLLTLTIQNTSTFTLTGLGFEDALPGILPAGLEVAVAPAPVNNCGGTLTAATGSQLIRLENGTLAGDSSCSIIVSVRGPTPGDYQNCIPIGALTNDQGAQNHEAACDTLTVTAPVVSDPALTKSVDPATAQVGDAVTFTLSVTNNGPAAAQGVVVTDVLPAFLDISGVLVSPTGPAVTIAGNSISIAFGSVSPSDVFTVTITSIVNALGTPPGGTNTADLTTTSIDTDTANNEASVGLTIVAAPTRRAPATGFAPDRVTVLPVQPGNLAYQNYAGLWLEIPSLDIGTPIVGVPLRANGWDVTWLEANAGYLAGTAFPTWKGNSVITGHVTLPSGLAGPFAKLRDIRFGDRILVRAWGSLYTYEVQEAEVAMPDDPVIFRHEDRPWITLVTCQDYDPLRGEYRRRYIVKAVLVRVE